MDDHAKLAAIIATLDARAKTCQEIGDNMLDAALDERSRMLGSERIHLKVGAASFHGKANALAGAVKQLRELLPCAPLVAPPMPTRTRQVA